MSMATVISTEAFMEHLKKEDLIIVPRKAFEARLVQGMELSEYRKILVNKPMLSLKEIADGQLWGVIGKGAVKVIVKKEVPVSKLTRLHNGTIKVPREVVRNIAIARGMVFN